MASLSSLAFRSVTGYWPSCINNANNRDFVLDSLLANLNLNWSILGFSENNLADASDCRSNLANLANQRVALCDKTVLSFIDQIHPFLSQL